MGLAVTVVPVVALNPVAGAHTYVEAPLAVSATLPPGQIDGAAGVHEIGTVPPTFTVTVVVPTQPAAVVPVMVYVVVVTGVAVTVDPVVDDNPVAGDQLYVPPTPAPLAVNVAL